MTAIKNDGNKPPMELLPTLSLEEVAKVLGFGKDKYGAFNWAQGFEWSRLIGAANRHLAAFQRGEDTDPETGLSHIAHLACTSLFLLEHQLRSLGVDNRYKFNHTENIQTETHEREIEGGFGKTVITHSTGVPRK